MSFPKNLTGRLLPKMLDTVQPQLSLPSAGTVKGLAPGYRRVFSTGSESRLPAGAKPADETAELSRTGGLRASVPQAVKSVLDDVRAISPQAPGGERQGTFESLRARHDGALRECAGTPTPSGRNEFLADTTRRALDSVSSGLGKWVSGRNGELTLHKKEFERVHADRHEMAGLMTRKDLAQYASVIHPDLRAKYGLSMTSDEMTSLGFPDKGPYLSEGELMALCDHGSGDSGSFQLYSTVEVLSQQLGLDHNPFQPHVEPLQGQMLSALNKLRRHPGLVERADCFKGLLLGAYQENGLKSLCKSGGKLPLGVLGMAATKNQTDSYVHKHGYGHELVMRGVPVVKTHVFQNSTDYARTGGEEEVRVLGDTHLSGVEMQTGSRINPDVGSQEPFTRFVFQVKTPGDGKGAL